MNADLDGPADTQLMGIVHNALRRDLARAEAAVGDLDPPLDDQRVAIAEHLLWLMAFLQRHHEAEDNGLYPLVRLRNPGAAALLDAMDVDHLAIVPAMDELEAAGRAYATDAAAATRVLAALDGLARALLPHLTREEEEMMPVVSRSITEREWRAWDQEYNVRPLAKPELAVTGLWIMDDQTPDDRERVAELVPPVPRWFILNFVAPSYQRAAFRRWRLPRHSALRAPLTGGAEVVTSASPRAVWDVLSDVTRVGEWSHECRGATWLDGVSTVAVGARFRGRNRSGIVRWSRACEVVVADKPRELVYRTDGGFYGDSSQWRFRLEPVGTGTRVVQTFRVLRMPVAMDRFVAVAIPGHKDRTAALLGDLERLVALAERVPAVLSRSA